MRTEHTWIEPNAAYPVADEARILSGREALIRLTLRGKKEFSALSVRHKEVVIDRLPGLFGDLEPYRLGRSSSGEPSLAQQRIRAEQYPRL